MCHTESCSLPPLLCPIPTPIMPSHQLTQPMKPKLPLRLASSARINLNRYWHALEDLMPLCRKPFDESDSNAINENIDNERKLAAMRLSGVQRSEGAPESPMADASLTDRNIINSNSHSCTKLSPSSSNITNTSLRSKPFASFSLMSEDEFSSDENTPPSSFGKSQQ